MQRSQRLHAWEHPTPEERPATGGAQWSPVREAERLVERHEKLLALEYSRAGWKTAQMIEERMHAIADRLLTASSGYPSLRWLLDKRDVQPTFDLARVPDLAAVVTLFDYFESMRHPEDPRRVGRSG